MKTFDYVIIGSGSAAMAGATKAGDMGVKIAIIERSPVVGGTCVNVGCVPSKHLITIGDLYYYASHHGFDSVTGGEGMKFDFKKAIEGKRRLVAELRHGKYEQVLANIPGLTKFNGTATFIDDNTVDVDGQTINGEKFLIATGSSASIPPIEGLANIDYLTNIEAMELEELPESMIVLGGGPLGLEFAQMYAHFGTEVCVVQRNPRLLPQMEPEIGEAIKGYLADEGIQICVGAAAQNVREENGEKVLTVKVGDETREYRGEQLLVATGRRPNTKDLNLGKAGVGVGKRGEIIINEEQQTSVPHIYAGGDVRGGLMLETTAAKEGTIATENALNDAHRKMDHLSIPNAIFTHPQAAQVGMTDEVANSRGFTCSCRVLDFSIIPKAQVIKDTWGVIKMVAEAGTGRILGVSILAPGAADLIHEATIAVKFKLTIYDIIDTVHVFPTLSESIKLVAQSYLKDISKLPCCTG